MSFENKAPRYRENPSSARAYHFTGTQLIRSNFTMCEEIRVTTSGDIISRVSSSCKKGSDVIFYTHCPLIEIRTIPGLEENLTSEARNFDCDFEAD